jgi:hypothetical protein
MSSPIPTLSARVGSPNSAFTDYQRLRDVSKKLMIHVVETEIKPETTCSGCIEDQPNQMAHTGPGGCLEEKYEPEPQKTNTKRKFEEVYEEDPYPFVNDLVFTNEVVKPDLLFPGCYGCQDNLANQAAHMGLGGCMQDDEWWKY